MGYNLKDSLLRQLQHQSKNPKLLLGHFVSLSETLHNFARKALQQQLPTASNLCKWKRITDPNCTLCKQGVPPTNKHVLSHCSAPIALERYTTRHNHILKLLADWIMREMSDQQKLYADISGDYNPIDEIFEPAVRPDIALVDGSKIVILELTVCHESNLEKSKLFKIEKYTKIREHLKIKYKTFSTKLFTIEISVLGFISDLTEFIKFAKLSKMRKDTNRFHNFPGYKRLVQYIQIHE